MTSAAQPSSPPRLDRQLGLWDATSIVVGIILGAGIFVVPGLVARSLPSPTLILAAWLFSGVLSLLGALVFSELGAMMPETGGHYVFLREGLAPVAGFLCGWTYFLIIQPSVTAYLATSFSIYLGYFVPLSGWVAKAVSLALIFILCGANYVGTRWGASVQNFFTVMKLAGLAMLIWSALAAPNPQPILVDPPAWSMSAFGVAMIACLLSYDGWSYLSFVAGEVREPQRNLLRAAALGLAICCVIYLLVNMAYLRVLPMEEFIRAERPGSMVAERVLGRWGGMVVTLTILCSVIGSTNGQIMAPARMYFAQAADRLFFPAFARVHPRFRTPSVALLGVGFWSSILVLTSVWEALIDYALFATWVFATLVGVALVALRFKKPQAARPYKMWGYPATAAIYILIGTAFCVNTLIERTGPALVALGIILAGIPVFYVTLRKWTNSSGGATNSLP